MPGKAQWRLHYRALTHLRDVLVGERTTREAALVRLHVRLETPHNGTKTLALDATFARGSTQHSRTI